MMPNLCHKKPSESLILMALGRWRKGKFGCENTEISFYVVEFLWNGKRYALVRQVNSRINEPTLGFQNDARLIYNPSSKTPMKRETCSLFSDYESEMPKELQLHL